MNSESGASLTPIQRFRAHPAYGEALDRFRAARAAWQSIRDKLAEGLVVSTSMEAYCRSYFEAQGPILWNSSATPPIDELTNVVTQAWLDSAEP